MAIQQSVAGAYNSTWNSLVMFHTTNGFELSLQHHAEEIAETDIFGMSLIDYVFRGVTTKLVAEYKCYTTSSNAQAFFPWNSAMGILATPGAPIARLASDIAKSLVLTVVNNTPASVAGPSSLTASKAILSPNFNGKLLFNSKVRVVPIEFVCLPTDASGTTTAFTMT